MSKETFDVINNYIRMIQSTASVILNLLTIICVVKYRSLRNSAGILVVCLASTDTLHGLIIYTGPLRKQVRSICTVSLAVEVFTVCAQLLVFVLIAMERRNSLLVQLNRGRKWQLKKVILAVVGGWIAIASFNVGFALGSPLVPTDNTCTMIDTFPKPHTYVNIIYGVLCSVVILGFYCSIAKIVHSSGMQVAANASQTEQQRQRRQANLRITKMMALVVGVFLVLYAPLAISHTFIKKSSPLWQHIVDKITTSLGDINFWINPAIYAWRNKQFRKAMRQLFTACWRRCSSNNSVEPINAVSQHVNIQMVALGPSEPRPSTSRAIEPRREFLLGPNDLPRHQVHSLTPIAEV